MKKNKLTYNLLFAAGISCALFACSDDDGAKTSVGFEGITSSYMEADAPGDVFIPFRDGSVAEAKIELSGTATEGDDYTVSYGADGITVSVLDDDAAEGIETIRFTISGSTGASNSTHTVRILSDDPGFVQIDLDWTGGSDLDLYLFYEDATGFHQVSFSDPGGPLFVDWTDDDGTYHLSYNYYSGTNNAQDFTSTFTPTGVTVNGATTPAVYNGLYTLDNVDPNNIQFEQSFEKTGTVFVVSELDIPAEGSRKAQRKSLPNPRNN